MGGAVQALWSAMFAIAAVSPFLISAWLIVAILNSSALLGRMGTPVSSPDSARSGLALRALLVPVAPFLGSAAAFFGLLWLLSVLSTLRSDWGSGGDLGILVVGDIALLIAALDGWLAGLLVAYLLLVRHAGRLAGPDGQLLLDRERRWYRVGRIAAILGLVLGWFLIPLSAILVVILGH